MSMNSWHDIVTPKTPLPQTFPDCAITELSHFGLIRATGSDVRTFLQGQLTNDINQVTPALAQLSSYCSPKGRMLGSFWVMQRGDDLYLQLPADRLPGILKRLRMFVLRAQVTLEDASGELARFGITGSCAADLLPFAPGADKATATRDDITVIRLPGERPRFEIIGPVSALAPLWSKLSETATQTGPDFWSLMDIRAGVPNVFEDTVEAFVPQMANLQLIGGVSFTKGCYTGQEVVARMQYLGKLKRRMYLAHIADTQRPAPGAEVFSPSSESGQGAGRIVDAAPSPDGGFDVLAVLQISSAEAGDVRLHDAAGPVLELRPMPYDLPPLGD
ncbi:MAG: folate-binding protein YgfZ [Chromatiaceae bacterium]|nr:folate-binding protein YgfZ [Chromatiaceae bacterium]MCP5436533.1 folate-binding protein YgfZ [Chromatiaceae bacterium]